MTIVVGDETGFFQRVVEEAVSGAMRSKSIPARSAKAKGARFCISTDAHHPNHLANMRYGEITARRGWLEHASAARIPARHHPDVTIVVGDETGFFQRVVDEAVKRNVALEINSSPERLDLSASLARSAKAKGARFCISTDAHHPNHLANMRYGVLTARRGWLEKGDVLNTLPLQEFQRVITRM